MNEPPVRLCCGQRHFGPVCPDGLVMCCLCFARVEQDALHITSDGSKEDVCAACAIEEEEIIKHRITNTMQTEKLIPLGKRLLVLRDETKNMTTGGILLPDVAKEAPRRGKVLAVGDGCEVSLVAGDEVLLPRYGGTDVTHDNKACLLIEECDVLGKFHMEQPADAQMPFTIPPAPWPLEPDDGLDEPLGDRAPGACEGEVCESCQ